MNIRDFNPADGMAFQGDVAIVPIPAEIKVGTTDEIKPRDGRLILQEGELTGHHHAIELQRHFRKDAPSTDFLLNTRDRKLNRLFGRPGPKPASETTARMYRDPAAVEAMRAAGFLTRTDLAVGLLVIEGAPAIVQHEEHDVIRLPVGRYYVGRQIESAGAEERVVAD